MNVQKTTDPSPSKLGRFITLEGSEGAGKSTQLKVVEAWLQEHQIPYVLTREPGGPPLSEALRHLILNGDDPVCEEAELLMMFAARAQHIHETILPALAKGIWVVSDRFTDSTYAYQGRGRGFDLAHIQYLESWIQKDLQPDLTLMYDLPVEIGLGRTTQRNHSDRIEQESIAFFERVRLGFLERAQGAPARFRVIDASQSLDQVSERTRDLLSDFSKNCLGEPE